MERWASGPCGLRGRRLVGAITDREYRGRGRCNRAVPVEMLVRDCMTEDISYAFEEEDAEKSRPHERPCRSGAWRCSTRRRTWSASCPLGDIAHEPRGRELA